jgi:hypothetical protein
VLHTVVHHDVGTPDLGGADVDHTATGVGHQPHLALQSTFYIRLKILPYFTITYDPVTSALAFVRVVCAPVSLWWEIGKSMEETFMVCRICSSHLKGAQA